MLRKFSLGIKITSRTPAHITISLYGAMIPSTACHEDITRAHVGNLEFRGDLTWRCLEFDEFVRRIHPDVISILETGEEVPEVIHELYAFQAARETWDWDK